MWDDILGLFRHMPGFGNSPVAELMEMLRTGKTPAYEVFRRIIRSQPPMLTMLNMDRGGMGQMMGMNLPFDASFVRDYTHRLALEASENLTDPINIQILLLVGELRGVHFFKRAVAHLATHPNDLRNNPVHRTDSALMVMLAAEWAESPDEHAALVAELSTYPAETLRMVLPLALDGYSAVCEALDWQNALPLVQLLITTSLEFDEGMSMSSLPRLHPFGMLPQEIETPYKGALDVPAANAALETAGKAQSDEILKLFKDSPLQYAPTLNLINALRGTNRKKVEGDFARHLSSGIRAYGLLPLGTASNAVQDRYRALKQSARLGEGFKSRKRREHLAAVQVGLLHLAAVANYPDLTALEWAMEAEIAENTVGRIWTVGEYQVTLIIEDIDPKLHIQRGDKVLKSTPKTLSATPEYAEAKAVLEETRAWARRLRGDLLEGLLVRGDALTADQLASWARLPLAAAMLERLLFRLPDGTIGLWTPIAAAPAGALRSLDGTLHPLTENVTAAHVYDLFQAGTLAAWQAYLVQQRLVQPIKQAFRELYLLTPAEENTHTHSNRFAGQVLARHTLHGVAGRRGWRFDGLGAPCFYKQFPGGLRACLNLPDWDYAAQIVTTDQVYFERGSRTPAYWHDPTMLRVLLSEISPLRFSEVMRDVDMFVAVAATDGEQKLSTEAYQRRGDLILRLLDSLELTGVTVEPPYAFVQGKLARYRVHLGSALIHIVPGNYLCIVPDRWGQTHEKLFLPFADENDRKVSEVISKILLLLADHNIKDESILRQIRAQSG